MMMLCAMSKFSFTSFALLVFACLPSLSLSAPYTSHEIHGTLVKRHGTVFVGHTDEYYGVSTWLGIRYAQPPIGSLRLQPPRKVDNEGIINATSFGAKCFQLSTPANATNNISEDCLYLNIYRPSEAALKKHCENVKHLDALPVMFFIHGGAFNDGSGEMYDARSLVNTSVALHAPVVVVTINYRLSFFGFSAGTTAIANNALNLGLLDQRMALQWVQDYIRFFGGDPRMITLWGQSAGAASAGLQITAYNGTKQHLFRAAILQSGSPPVRVPTPPATWPPYQQAWDYVIATIGCNTTTNLTAIFSCVQTTPAPSLFHAIAVVARELSPLPTGTAPWEPVVDGHFVAEFPTQLVAHHSFSKIPMITGFTTDELTYLIPTSLNISSDTILAGVARAVLSFVPIPTILQLLSLDPLAEYPNPSPSIVGERLANAGQEWKRTTEITSDLFERCPGWAFARNMSLFKPVWKYRWNAAVPAQVKLVPEEGIVHGSELPYLFGRSYVGGNPYVVGGGGIGVKEEADLELSEVMQKAWVAFAGYLNPNWLGELSGQHWPKYRTDSEHVLVFQKKDGSGEFANGSFGVPPGQGLHLEKDPDDRQMCEFIVDNDAVFVH